MRMTILYTRTLAICANVKTNASHYWFTIYVYRYTRSMDLVTLRVALLGGGQGLPLHRAELLW